MIRVDIDPINNRATYATHRVLNRGEKILVESYIENQVLSTGDVYNISGSDIRYIGEDAILATEYTKFQNEQDKNAFEKLHKKDQKITKSVRTIIDGANKEFCFYRIGDILLDRKENHSEELDYMLAELKETVSEYNSLVSKDKQVDIKNLIN